MALSAFGLAVLLPLLTVVAVLVRRELGLPVLFRQHRPGLHGRPFTLYKFRTMTGGCDQQGRLLPDAERLTQFGRVLRGASLDELPELFSVFKGEWKKACSRTRCAFGGRGGKCPVRSPFSLWT
jgi:lipopolysaccharide/colanic/teichoic acid biosynthesis glycosyltransferase